MVYANETAAYDGTAVIDADRRTLQNGEIEVTFAPGLYGMTVSIADITIQDLQWW